MKKKKKSPVLSVILIVLVLVIAVEAVILLRSTLTDSGESFSYSTPIPFVPPTAEPSPEPTATPAPAATAAPTPAPTPEPTPEPTATPTTSPEATPADDLIATGSFASDTGTALNLEVEWSSHNDGNGNAVIYLTGFLDSYSLQVGSRPYGVHVSFNGDSWTFAGEAINVADGHAETLLFSDVVTVPLGSPDAMTVVYDFKGSYSGTELDTITAEGRVNTGWAELSIGVGSNMAETADEPVQNIRGQRTDADSIPAAAATAVPTPVPTATPPVLSVSITCWGGDMEGFTQRVGDEVQLDKLIFPMDSGAEVTWSSTDEEVAVVDQTGLVTLVGPGNCYIKLSAGGLEDSCQVISLNR